MKYLLDTHILLWWALDHDDLSSKHAKLITANERAGEPLGLSVISLWEIAKLVQAGRFRVSYSLDAWFGDLESSALLRILPLTPTIILDSTRLGAGFHKDPADQLITATARCHGLSLLTEDARIRKSGVVAVG